ncbi:HRDC domain-containing protein [Corynebacterium sp. LaCa54]|uniref:HRDC domain-containing protein n=1 Tax=Corynebacterium sp. LaCa54 TaxID=3391428 RepID=UPI0039896BCF
MPELRSRPVEGIPAVLATRDEFTAAAARLAAGTGPFAIDTERASGYRYDDRAFVVQIRRCGAGTMLFAPEGHRAELTAALAPVLNGAEWIIHAAHSDLPCLGWLGLFPGSIFDTELAARLAGFDRPNLGTMVAELFDIELEKGYGDADWSTPQLSEELKAYAALDVELLLELADSLRDILAEQDKMDWALEEFSSIVREHAGDTHPQPPTWRDLKGVSNLRNGNQLTAARALWLKRDAIARRTDTAPGRVLANKTLVEIARALPTSGSDLARIKGFPRRRKGATARWMAVLNQARAIPPHQRPRVHRTPHPVPSKTIWTKDYPDLWEIYQTIRADIAELGDDLGMSSELIIRPATVRAAVWAKVGVRADKRHRGPDSVAGSIRQPDDVAAFLRAEGAREWQIELTAPLIVDGLF